MHRISTVELVRLQCYCSAQWFGAVVLDIGKLLDGGGDVDITVSETAQDHYTNPFTVLIVVMGYGASSLPTAGYGYSQGLR